MREKELARDIQAFTKQMEQDKAEDEKNQRVCPHCKSYGHFQPVKGYVDLEGCSYFDCGLTVEHRVTNNTQTKFTDEVTPCDTQAHLWR